MSLHRICNNRYNPYLIVYEHFDIEFIVKWKLYFLAVISASGRAHRYSQCAAVFHALESSGNVWNSVGLKEWVLAAGASTYVNIYTGWLN